jgi:hypothetical protein
MRVDQWDGYIHDVFRILKPGNGWAQFGEIRGIPIWDDDNVPQNSLLARVSLSIHVSNDSFSKWYLPFLRREEDVLFQGAII